MTSDITNVDLRFLRKARGVAPLSRYALADDGSVVVALPDSMEVRTVHFARFDPTGKSRVEETYAVETLRKTDIGAGGGGIGITDDDLYLFRDSKKSRFLPDRRANYSDIALCASGNRFVTAFSDMLASGHAIAWGDIGGRALWTKDIAFPVARVAVDRQGSSMAAAGDTGELIVLDSSRNTLVQFRHEMPLRAVATIGAARTVFAGVGGVGAVDSEGRLAWFTELVGDPIELAIDAEARTTAVLLRLDDTTGRLVFLSIDGLPTWEVDIDESRPTGVSLSANGRFAAVTLRDGSLSTYELHYGERVGVANAGSLAVIEARSAREAGNYQTALHLLRARLAAQPEDADTADVYRETLDELRARSITSAENAEAVGDFAAADGRLLLIIEENPFDTEAVARRSELRRRWSAEARGLGEAALEAGNGSEAELRFLEAIEADPLDRDSRLGLALARASTTRAAIERGFARIEAGDFAGASAVLADVQTRGGNSPEVADLLRRARIGEAMALGNALYQDRQYAAALFQYKKALRLDPNNVEARQRVSYSQNFLQDTQLNDRFTRLE